MEMISGNVIISDEIDSLFSEKGAITSDKRVNDNVANQIITKSDVDNSLNNIFVLID